MNNKSKIKYILISFGWSYLLWILAFVISGFKIDTGINIVKSFQSLKVENILFSLAVFGPMIGYFFIRNEIPKTAVGKDKKLLTSLMPLILPIAFNILPFILLLINNSSVTFNGFLILEYFVLNFITSGTEEIGWRGGLLKLYLNKEKSFWDLSFKTGIIWAFWHLPLVLYMYMPMGIGLALTSFAGFAMAIVGMNYISNWLYVKTGSVILLMIMHALNNTASFILSILSSANPYQFITIVAVWLTVAFIEKTDTKFITESRLGR